MKAYIFETGASIEPLGDPAADSFLGGEKLADAVRRALRHEDIAAQTARSGSDVPPGEDCLILPDNLFFTRRCLQEFLRASCGRGGIVRLALARGPATDYARPLTETEEIDGAVAFDLFRTGGQELPGEAMDWPRLRTFLRERAELAVLDPGGEAERLPQSRPGPPRQTLALPRTTLLCAEVRHWAHLVWINHLLPWIRLSEHWEDRPGPRRAWRRRGGNPYKRAARLSIVGRNCDIHPTAAVEGSILGDRVKLGPFCSVRDSILGDRVEVSEHTKFLRCVVGERCHTLNDSYFIGCTFYPGSTLANVIIRDSVLGRRVFLTTGVMFWDEAIDAPVQVVDRGGSVATGRWNLGGCAGHECLLGTRAIFLPGRAVPGGTVIVMRPEEGLFKLPASIDAAGAYVYHQRALERAQQALPWWRPPELE